jgi:hypothetical protein|nr:MAG TPA: hypothetical protein [Caudoviricetes sp.]
MKVKDLFDVLIGTEDVRIFTAGRSSIWGKVKLKTFHRNILIN